MNVYGPIFGGFVPDSFDPKCRECGKSLQSHADLNQISHCRRCVCIDRMKADFIHLQGLPHPDRMFIDYCPLASEVIIVPWNLTPVRYYRKKEVFIAAIEPRALHLNTYRYPIIPAFGDYSDVAYRRYGYDAETYTVAVSQETRSEL